MNSNLFMFIKYINNVIDHTAINCYKKLKQKQKNEISIEEIDNSSLSFNYDEDEFFLTSNVEHLKLENIFTNKIMYIAIKRLNDKEKLVLSLSILQNLSASDISKIMNISENNIWNIKSRAIKKIKKFVEDSKDE